MLAATEAVGVEPRGTSRVVRLADGGKVVTTAVIVATGVRYRQLAAPGVAALKGRGVYHGAGAHEAVGCGDQDVYIVGGANSAGRAATPGPSRCSFVRRLAGRQLRPRRTRLPVYGTRPAGGRPAAERLAAGRDPYHLESSMPGVFVAGDVRYESVKRVASAVGEGAMAVTLVHRYLAKS
jgi:thioredoxin reductase